MVMRPLLIRAFPAARPGILPPRTLYYLEGDVRPMTRAVKGHGFDRLATVEDARSRFLRLVRQGPLAFESVSLNKAASRVLARAIRAKAAVPPFHRAAMDGFAVRSKDTFGATPTNPLPLAVRGVSDIGLPPKGRVTPGTCFRIATGAMLPQGADAVVMFERTRELRGGQIEVEVAATPWANVSRRGEDVRAGETLLLKGVALESQDIGLCAALGHAKVPVARRPRVGVLSSGDELVPGGKRLRGGQVHDANRPAGIAAVEAAGAQPVDLGIVRDDLEAFRRVLGRALPKLDAIVVSGATSVGAKDFAPEAVASLGRPGVVIHGVGMRPGYPVALGAVRGKPIALLPGSPVAALLNIEEFVVPAIHKMLGREAVALPRGALVRARAVRRIPGAAGLRTYARVVVFEENGALLAEPIRISGAAILSSMVRGSGLVIIPPEKEGIEEGEEVEVRLLRALPPHPARPAVGRIVGAGEDDC